MVLDMEVLQAVGLEAEAIFGLETFSAQNEAWFSIDHSARNRLLPHSAELGIPQRRAHILRPRGELPSLPGTPVYLAHFCKFLRLQGMVLERRYEWSWYSVALVQLDGHLLLMAGEWTQNRCVLKILPEIKEIPHDRSVFLTYA